MSATNNTFICKLYMPTTQFKQAPRSRSRSGSRDITPLNTSNASQTARHTHNQTTTSAASDTEKYCVFTCNEESSLIIATQKPIQNKLLDSLLLQETDIEYICKTALNNAEIFKFDRAYGSREPHSKIYTDYVKQYTHGLMSGKNGLIVMFGPSDGGKSSLIKEKTTEKGILPKIIEDVFKIAELTKQTRKDVTYDVTLSFTGIYLEKAIDLLDVANKQVELKKDADGNWYPEKQKEKLLKNLNELSSVLQHTEKIRKMEGRSEGEDDIINKSHLIITISVGKYSKGQMVEETVLQIAEICGSEQASGAGKLQKSVARSFNYLSDAIYNAGIGKMYSYISKTTLTKVLSPTLGPHNPILVISCISPSPNSYIHSLPALKYTTSIRECIRKDLLSPQQEKFEGSQLETIEKEMQSNNMQHAEKKVFENWYSSKKQELNNCLNKYKSLYNEPACSNKEVLISKIESTNRLLEMLEEYKVNHQIKYEPDTKPNLSTDRKVEELAKKVSKLESSIRQNDTNEYDKDNLIYEGKPNMTYPIISCPTNNPNTSYKHESMPSMKCQTIPDLPKPDNIAKENQHEIQLLNEEIKDKNALIQKYEETISEHKQSYEAQFNQIKESLNKKISDITAKYEEAAKLNDESKQTIKTLSTELDCSKNECSLANDENKILDAKINQLTEQKNDMSRTMVAFTKKEEELEKANAILTNNSRKLAKDYEMLKQEMALTHSDVKTFNNQLETVRENKKEVEKNYEIAREERDEAKKAIEELQLTLKKMMSEFETKLKESANLLKSSEQRMQTMSDMKSQLSDKLTAANQKEAELTKENHEMATTLKKTTTELEIIKKEIAQCNTEKKSFEARLITAESKCETLIREKMQVESELLQAKSQAMEMETKISEHQRIIAMIESSKQAEIDSQMQKCLNLEIQVAGNKDELDVLSQCKKELEDELKEAKERMEKLNSQLKELEDMNDTGSQKYELHIESLNTEIQGHVAENIKLKEMLESTKLLKDKSEQMSTSLQEERDEMAKANKTLKKQIKDLEKVLSSYEEKNVEAKENSRKENVKETKSNDEVKTKILGDIQTMIKQFRDDRSKKRQFKAHK